MTRTPHRIRAAVGVALVLLAALNSSSCGRKALTFSREDPSGEWRRLLPPPADKEVNDLVDGLKSGDSVEGYPVLAVGAVNPDGVIQIFFKKDSLGVIVDIAELSDFPPAPASSKQFGVYYEKLGSLQNIPPRDCESLAAAIADRLKRTESKVLRPKGLKPLPRPTTPT
jgi:hypothetical protein